MLIESKIDVTSIWLGVGEVETMGREIDQMKPRIKQSGLVVRELEDEILVYDMSGNTAHCLNRAAGLVWLCCDGTATIAEITERVSSEIGQVSASEVVYQAIERFQRDGLLEGDVAVEGAGISRRKMLQVSAAAVSIPLVTTLLAPTAAMAASAVCGTACDSKKGNYPAQCGASCQYCHHVSGQTYVCSSAP